MGEVYRARDVRLAREVAIKVLPSELSADPHRLSRFEQEARAASALNHPNIVTVHDVGKADGTAYIAMELVEGRTVREVLGAGPLPLRKLLAVAAQVAEGLAKAHGAGMVHRDLKPENLMVSSDGFVKILDFGLAKVVMSTSGASSLTPTAALAETESGTILGTVSYMSPEQAEGKPLDFRSDQFSFGSILYEMATGKRAFERAKTIDTLSAILNEEPNPIALENPAAPAPLRWIVERCLAKDARERYASSLDLARDLSKVREHISELSGSEAALSPGTRPSRRGRLGWIVAAAALLVVAAFLGTAYFRSRPAPGPSLHVSVLPPEGKTFAFVGEGAGDDGLAPAAISPDGRRLVFGAQEAGTILLYVRTFDAFEARPLEGTAEARYPFWSPDSAWVGYFQGGKLKRIRATGGPAEVIADAPNPRGGSWGRDGTIVFAPHGGGAIFRVSERGGAVTPVTFPTAPESEVSHRFPSVLPDGRHFLFLASKLIAGAMKVREEDVGIFLGSTVSRETRRLLPDKSNAVYAPPGFVLFRREQTLMALPFDVEALKATGAPIPVADKIQFSFRADGVFSASSTGRLVYRTSAGAPLTRLAWLDRSGKVAGSPQVPAAILDRPRLSPDGRQAVVGVFDEQTSTDASLWIYDLERGSRVRLPSISVGDAPVWSPDGRRIAFGSSPVAVASELYVTDASGEGKPELLSTTEFEAVPLDWSSDGRWILLRQAARKEFGGNYELWIWSVAEKKASPYLRSEGKWSVDSAVFSPDGRWIAYQSTESGNPEVFVRPFPGPGERRQISRAGGVRPHWSRDGREIVFRSEGKLMAVDVKTQGGIQTSEPRVLLTLPANIDGWDITGDHRRVLAQVLASEQKPAPPLSVVTNWAAELKK
jgi:Tol biopolymer transport system component